MVDPVVIRGTYTLTATTASVGTSSVTVLAANADRKYAHIQNDSDTVVYLGIGAAGVANKGHRLNASGGEYEMSGAKGNLDTRAIYAISSAAAKNLIVKEG